MFITLNANFSIARPLNNCNHPICSDGMPKKTKIRFSWLHRYQNILAHVNKSSIFVIFLQFKKWMELTQESNYTKRPRISQLIKTKNRATGSSYRLRRFHTTKVVRKLGIICFSLLAQITKTNVEPDSGLIKSHRNPLADKTFIVPTATCFI